jgi:hypothetical protein
MAQYRLFFDRRVWSNGSLVVEAGCAEEALQLYNQGVLHDCMEQMAWDDDDIEVSLVDVTEQRTETAS